MSFSTHNSVIAHLVSVALVQSRIINKNINRPHGRCLRIIYGDKQSSFKELLEKDSSVSIHERNFEILATEMDKVSKDMSPPQITELFPRRNEYPYNLRHNAEFLQPFVNTVRWCTEGISYLDPNIWGMVPDTIYIIYITSKRLLKYGSLKTSHVEFVRLLSKI